MSTRNTTYATKVREKVKNGINLKRKKKGKSVAKCETRGRRVLSQCEKEEKQQQQQQINKCK